MIARVCAATLTRRVLPPRATTFSHFYQPRNKTNGGKLRERQLTGARWCTMAFSSSTSCLRASGRRGWCDNSIPFAHSGGQQRATNEAGLWGLGPEVLVGPELQRHSVWELQSSKIREKCARHWPEQPC